jgi:hypothetical protein
MLALQTWHAQRKTPGAGCSQTIQGTFGCCRTGMESSLLWAAVEIKVLTETHLDSYVLSR